jgi:hypothetical protein
LEQGLTAVHREEDHEPNPNGIGIRARARLQPAAWTTAQEVKQGTAGRTASLTPTMSQDMLNRAASDGNNFLH